MLEDRLGSLEKIERDLDDAATLVDLAETEGDEAVEAEGIAALRALKAEGERRELEALLSGEADANDSYVEVHSGAGGTESCDWARMLLRMYVRWAERRKFKVELIEETAGDEAGIKSATIIVKGHNAHGWLKTGVRAFIAWCASRRSIRTPAGIRALPRCGSIRSSTTDPDRGQRERLPDRHLSRLRRRRTARQQDRIGGADHPCSHRHRRRLPVRALTAQEPGDRLEHAASPPLRARARETGGQGQRRCGLQDRHRLGPSDPLLRAAALSDGEGPEDRPRLPVRPPRSSTATSIRSWRLRSPTACPAARWRSRTSNRPPPRAPQQKPNRPATKTKAGATKSKSSATKTKPRATKTKSVFPSAASAFSMA